ncbi:unnamed protein product [Withania somnifera]
MKISKSILSPSHARYESPLSLPTSLSRRLKANGSIKGGQSPATFPTTMGKKRGSSFDNPEPSSPKVTCIGQVKMKTKTKVRQTRSLSNRRSGVSFRKVEQAAPEERGLLIQNQKTTASLPLTMYEALREFSCLFPCRSSCFSTNEKEKETQVNGFREVVARWLVTLQDVEAEKMEEMQSTTMRSSRRHVFEGVEFKDIHDESIELKEGTVEEEKGRVSICIPPKNALLLMRCRSDPMKMADITNRFLQSPTRKEVEYRKEIRENEGLEELVDAQNMECRLLVVENEENPEAVKVMEMEMGSKTEQEDEEESIKALAAAEVNSIEQVAESIIDQTTRNNQNNKVPELEKEEDHSIHSYSSFSDNYSAECTETENEGKVVAEHAATLEEEEDDDEKFKSTIEKIMKKHSSANAAISVSKVEYTKEPIKQQNESILPDCLLLMMCVPKLSMEVSKETWVCSSTTDFIEREQAKKVKNKEVYEEQNKSQYLPLQPPRSSCSLPAMSMATMIEQKLLNTLAYEPLVLTRCKSEPMRIVAAKLEPETCFWKNRKIEPHRRATFGFGAAGFGF